MSYGSRGIFIGAVLLAAAAAGGCACGGYQVNIHPGDDLRSLPALPLALYFAPEAEVARLDPKGFSANQWFGSWKQDLLIDGSMHFPDNTITAGKTFNKQYPSGGKFQKKTAKIYIWVDYPLSSEAAKKSRAEVDPKKVQKCTLDIQVTLQGIVVRSGGQVIASS